MTAKEQKLADTLKCPNCEADSFTETHINCALGFVCDCGLKFNMMPIGGHPIIEITHDPSPVSDEALKLL